MPSTRTFRIIVTLSDGRVITIYVEADSETHAYDIARAQYPTARSFQSMGAMS